MKKTFKLVGIFMAVMLVVSVATLAVYVLINNNKTYYIYDLRFVEPISNKAGFIYTDPEQEYVTLRNKQVYLSSTNEDRIPVAIYANTSAVNPPLEYSSSDSSIADLVVDGDKCYIEYYKVGEATITINIDKVSDTFKISVFNQVADEFYVYDEAYYGKFSKIDYFKNKLVSYSDGITYKYSYDVLSGYDVINEDLSVEEAAKENVNSNFLRIDKEKINTDVFDEVSIDPTSKKLVVKCKTGLTSSVDEVIFLQSFTVSADGSVKTNKPYDVHVHIIAYTPEFLQAELSTNPDFTDNVIFMNTLKPDVDITEENIDENIDNLNKLLDYEKAEKYLAMNDETSTYHAYFTEKVSKIYIRFRMIYTNGDVVELLPELEGSGSGKLYTLSGDLSALKVYQNGKFFVMEGDSTKNITLTLNNVALSNVFKFEYKSLNEENILNFYDKKDGIYTYTYWDPRTYYDGEIADANGNIVGVIA